MSVRANQVILTYIQTTTMPPKNSKSQKRAYQIDVPAVPAGTVAVDIFTGPSTGSTKSNQLPPAKKRKETTYVNVEDVLKTFSFSNTDPLSTDGIFIPDPELPGYKADMEMIGGANINIQVKKKKSPSSVSRPFLEQY
jgi:hypothetical protein